MSLPRRISFDLDDTLICYQPGTACEPCRFPFLQRHGYVEPLRLGARELFLELQRTGWEIWILTTSYRSPLRVHLWLRAYGLTAVRVINQRSYEKAMGKARGRKFPTKNPRLYEILLHVDDSEGVQREGRQHGFEVVVVNPADPHWTKRVLEAAGGAGTCDSAG